MATPTGGLASQTPATPDSPIFALDINLAGGYINNPLNSGADLYVDPVTDASTSGNGTTMALVPGQTFYAIPSSTLQVSVASRIANHVFVSVQWT
jgi:hypothetical protein